MNSQRIRSMAALTVAGTLLVSCQSGDDGDDVSEVPASSEPTESPLGDPADELVEETSQPTQVELPDTSAGRATAEVLEALDAEEDAITADWEDRLHPEFQSEFPAEEFVEILNTGFLAAGPWTATNYTGGETSSITRIESPDEELDLHVVVDDDELITGLWFAPTVSEADLLGSFQEIHAGLEEFSADVSALVLENGDPLLELEPNNPAPLASTAKLYVLLAVTQAVEAGGTSWDDTLTLTDELRSLPTGTLQDEDEGFEITVEDAAQAMIQHSDNTATDMILDHLGRESVEEAVEFSGHHDPDLMRPFLATRELFQLRWGEHGLAESGVGAEWGDADEDSRREVLTELEDAPLPDLAEVDLSQVDHEIDWHASAVDVAVVHQTLADYAAEHPELVSILGSNPGLAMTPQDPWWETLAYKGGSIPGVLTGSWHVTDDDGTSRTVIILARSEDAEDLAEHEVQQMVVLAQSALTASP